MGISGNDAGSARELKTLEDYCVLGVEVSIPATGTASSGPIARVRDGRVTVESWEQNDGSLHVAASDPRIQHQVMRDLRYFDGACLEGLAYNWHDWADENDV